MLDRLGIAEQVKAKAKPNTPERELQAVAAGEVELAIGATPLILSAKGVQLVGPFPGEFQDWFVNTAGVSAYASFLPNSAARQANRTPSRNSLARSVTRPYDCR